MMDTGQDFGGWPAETPEMRLGDGYPRVGQYVKEGADGEEALYYFPGDFIVGDGFELWLTWEQTQSAEALLGALTVDED